MEIIKFSTALKLFPDMLIDSKENKNRLNFLTNSSLDEKVFPILYTNTVTESGNIKSVIFDFINPKDVEFIDYFYRLVITDGNKSPLQLINLPNSDQGISKSYT